MATLPDVERFAFCAHAWQLGRDLPRQDDGLATHLAGHVRIASLLHEARRAQEESRVGLRWSLRVLAVAAALTLVTLQLVYVDEQTHSWTFLLASLVVLACSVGLFTLGLFDRRRAAELSQALGFDEVPGQQTLDNPIIRDEAWDLEGERGCVLQTGRRSLPIDVRPGRTPKKVYKEHAVHMAARLRLQEVESGVAPVYGLVTYPGGVFRIDWDAERRQQLKDLLDRLHDAQERGSADRDHQSAARCAACNLRSDCSQAL